MHAAAAGASDGYRFEAVYTADVLGNLSGGIDTGTRYLDNLDLTLEIDVAQAWRFGTGTLFAYGLYNNGSTFADELVGDLMVNSNIDAPGAVRMFELWYEVGTGPLSVRTGLYDLNSEFDVNETGALFLNSSHGIGASLSQTGENGPGIFPVSSLTLRVAYQHERFTTRFAVLDGVPGDPDDPASNRIDLGGDDGALLVAEADAPLPRSGRVWAGLWRYTADFERLNGSGTSNDNDGWYVGTEFDFELGSRSAAWFLRYGEANGDLNPFSGYLGAGVTIDGVLPSRPDDSIGLSVASGRVGEPYRGRLAGTAASHETEWELTYRARLGEHLVLQPDLQFVDNPAASGTIDDAWIAGLRLELSY